MSLYWLALGFFVAFLGVAAVDGVYFHLGRFRLWAHAETRLEHAVHTARAVLMPPAIAALFLPGSGWRIAAMLVALDTAAAALDVAVEWESRSVFGGLPRGEYATHLVATALHVAACTLAFAAKLLPDAGSSPACPGCAVPIVLALVLVTSLTAIQHIVLLARGRKPSTGRM